jgi:hypothetical protein
MAGKKKPLSLKLRAIECQDARGRHLVVRVDDQGNVAHAALFDEQGKEVVLGEEDRLDLTITIRNSSKKKNVLATRLCMCPYQVNGKTYYFPC